MINTIYGTKINQIQTFDTEGKRLVVTKIKTNPSFVVQIKTKDKDGYWALQLGIGSKGIKRINQPFKGQIKGANYKDTAPLYLREVGLGKMSEEEIKKIKIGDEIKAENILKEGDKVKVTARSKGKGFAGVVKRWGFAGGPKTHGQSDRERAPGSIGQRTTPGRVWKGKKMAGHMGNVIKTIKVLKIFKIKKENNEIWLQGLVPGPKKSLIKITKLVK